MDLLTCTCVMEISGASGGKASPPLNLGKDVKTPQIAPSGQANTLHSG